MTIRVLFIHVFLSIPRTYRGIFIPADTKKGEGALTETLSPRTLTIPSSPARPHTDATSPAAGLRQYRCIHQPSVVKGRLR